MSDNNAVKTRRTSLSDPNYYLGYFPLRKQAHFDENTNGGDQNDKKFPVTRGRHINLDGYEYHQRSNNHHNHHNNNNSANNLPNDFELEFNNEKNLNGKIETRFKGNPPKCNYQDLELFSEIPQIVPKPSKVDNKQTNAEDMKNQTILNNDQTDVEIRPVAIDSSITFESIGGLTDQLNTVKEIAILPLLYPDIYAKFSVASSKGILFHGPPGTGKTLLARAIASECDRFTKQIGKKMSFFVRKGADLLSKWVGETEKNFTSLFEIAKESKPSIIFFDEIDGLAPSRNSNQDHVHNSTVATFLPLLDGLELRGDIIVIGATNRLDSLDSALRRTGRFDRELYFPLPNEDERKHILEIHTSTWTPKMDNNLISFLAKKMDSFSGADIKGACNQAVLNSIRRCYPQIYDSSKRLKIKLENIYPNHCDFLFAIKTITPYYKKPNKEGLILESGTINDSISHLIDTQLIQFRDFLNKNFLFTDFGNQNDKLLSQIDFNGDDSNLLSINPFFRSTHFLYGHSDSGFLHYFMPECIKFMKEKAELFINIDLQKIILSETPIKDLLQEFGKVISNKKKIIFFSNFTLFWDYFEENAIQLSFINQIKMIKDEDLCLLVFCFPYSSNHTSFPVDLSSYLKIEEYTFQNPDEIQISKYLEEILSKKIFIEQKNNQIDSLFVPELSEDEEATKVIASVDIEQVKRMREKNLRSLRIILRAILKELTKNKNFSIFLKPVDSNEVEDYYKIITNPMCFEDIIKKIDSQLYTSIDQFKSDIEQIIFNALEYNPPEGDDLMIRHKAYDLRDNYIELIENFVDKRFLEDLEACLIAYNSLNNKQNENIMPNNLPNNLNLHKNKLLIVSDEELENTTISIDIHRLDPANTEPNKGSYLFNRTEINSLKLSILSKPFLKTIDSLIKINALISQQILKSSEFNLTREEVVQSIIEIISSL